MKSDLAICIPSYNCASFCNELCEDLLKIKLGNYKIDLLIFDDCSTDDTFLILNSYMARLEAYFHSVIILRQDKNVGAKANTEALLSHTNADFISLLDCDDKFSHIRFVAQLDAIVEKPNAVMIGARHVTIWPGESVNLTDKYSLKSTEILIDGYLQNMPPCQSSAVVFRSETLRRFDTAGYVECDMAHQIVTLLASGGTMIILDSVYSAYRANIGFSHNAIKNLSSIRAIFEGLSYVVSSIPRSQIGTLYLIKAYTRFSRSYLKILVTNFGLIGLTTYLTIYFKYSLAAMNKRKKFTCISLRDLKTNSW